MIKGTAIWKNAAILCPSPIKLKYGNMVALEIIDKAEKIPSQKTVFETRAKCESDLNALPNKMNDSGAVIIAGIPVMACKYPLREVGSKQLGSQGNTPPRITDTPNKAKEVHATINTVDF
jgi:hypothetical protein